VYVACSTLCFGQYPLERALETIAELRFNKVDLAIDDRGPHLKATEVATDATQIVQKLKKTNMNFGAMHYDPGDTTSEHTKEHLRSICRMARLLTVPVLSVYAASFGSDFETEVERLTQWARIASGESVILTVVTHHQTITADPLAALELCKRITGLGVTLDPSHYMIGPHSTTSFDALFPFVRHVRLRDTGSNPDQFQVRIGQGKVDYGRIVTQLQRQRYERLLSVDIRDIPDPGYPLEGEVRKLKYLLESLV
jgi:sugar phosphate isomerase/epimerase